MGEDELRASVGPDRVRTSRTSGGRGASELCRARLRLGLSHTQVARKVGVVPATVSRWENGARLPSPRIRPALAAALRITPTELNQLLVPIPGGRWDGHVLPGLRTLRTGAGLTQRGCADALGVSGATVNRWEQGACRVPRRRVEDLAAVLGVSVTHLLCEAGRPATTPLRPESALASMRRKTGMTQREAAALLGVSVGCLSRYEGGHRPLPVAVAVLAARIYRRPVAHVFTAAGLRLPRYPARPWTRSTMPAALRAARLHRGLSTAAASRLIGVSPQTLSRWEAGTSELPAAARTRLEAVYALPPRSLQTEPAGGCAR
nr:helix-turn-helix domain-containing protein [Klenkia brasiliensis]